MDLFLHCMYFFFSFFDLGFTSRQDHFTQFEPSQSKGGEKMGDPREKPPDHPQAELGLSRTHSGQVTGDLERLRLVALTTRPWGPPPFLQFTSATAGIDYLKNMVIMVCFLFQCQK